MTREAPELAVLHRQLVIRKAKVAFEPLEESRFKDAAASIESIAREPDQFGLMEAQFPGLFQLGAKLLDFDHIGEAQVGGAVDKRKRSGGFGEMLPDELEHQELVKIGVEQRPRNRVQLPIVVMGASREVDDHDVTTLPHSKRSSETGSIAPISWMVHVQPEAAIRGLVIRVRTSFS
jgi:hypothetical protein